MKVTRTKNYLVNLGNFENMNVGGIIEIDVDPNLFETPEQQEQLGNKLSNWLDKTMVQDLCQADNLTADSKSFIKSQEFEPYLEQTN